MYFTAVLTFNIEEAGGFEVFSVTSVCPWVIQSAIMNEQRSLAAINNHLVLLGLADILSISEPSYLCVLSGNFTLECGGGFLLHCLVLQRLRELNCWLWRRQEIDRCLVSTLLNYIRVNKASFLCYLTQCRTFIDNLWFSWWLNNRLKSVFAALSDWECQIHYRCSVAPVTAANNDVKWC